MSSDLEAQEFVEVRCSVNGRDVERRVPARRLLADFLREDVGLTGTHIGCEQGICGACTVMVDGAAARSCITLAAQIDGSVIRTVEDLAEGDELNVLQQAFKKSHGLQCGFCTSGFLMTLTAADPEDYRTDDEIRELLSGNLCRCTGYQNIVAAVREAWGRS